MPLLGFPGAFPMLLGAAAACVAPPRRAAGLAALAAGFLGWALVLVYTLAPLWGVAAAACGVVVATGRLRARA